MEKELIISPYVFVGIKPTDFPPSVKRRLNIRNVNCSQQNVIDAITEVTTITFEQMESRNRKGPIMNARHMYCFFMNKRLKWNLKQIGQSIGGRDHTTAINSIKRHQDLYDTCDIYREISDNVTYHIDWNI